MTQRRPCMGLRLLRSLPPIAILVAACCLGGRAHGQNDWQYPDPYFGILEIEKSHDSGTWRRYRAEVSPAPRRDATGSGGRIAGPVEQPPGQRSSRARWRTRYRR